MEHPMGNDGNKVIILKRKLETCRHSTTSWCHGVVSGSVHNFVDDCILSKNSKRKFQKDISYFHVDTPRVSMICDLITTASSPKFLSPVSHPARHSGQCNGLVVVRMWGCKDGGKPPKQKFKLVIVSRNWMGIVCCSLLVHLTHLSSETKKMR